VVKVALEAGDKIMGIVVDAVSDVYSITESDARDVPDVANTDNTEFVKGLVNVGEKMVVLLDLKRVLDLARGRG
jgi:purine-binding chemotaxis protein CheW